MEKKKCNKCGIEKGLSEFQKKKGGKFGVAGQCKECVKEQKKAYYEMNRKKIKEKSKTYYETNKECVNEKKKAYREINKEKKKAYDKAYNEANKEKRKAYREANKEKIKAYRETNKNKIKEYDKAWYEAKKDESQTKLLESIKDGSFKYTEGDNINFLYILSTGINDLYKVGISNNIDRRLEELNGDTEMTHNLLYFLPFKSSTVVGAKRKAMRVEGLIHTFLDDCNHKFDEQFGGSTEYFNATLEEVLEAVEATGIKGLQKY